MKQGYFKITCDTLKILHLESVRKMFYQVSIAFFLVFILLNIMMMAGSILANQPLFDGLAIRTFMQFFVAFFILFIGVILPTVLLFLAHRFPPAPEVIFHSDTQTATWKSGNNRLVVPFPTIHFATSRLLSKSGISTVMVSVFAIADKPFFSGDPSSDNPDMRYRKDLCIYKAGTQAEADESIEIVKSFMAGRYNESPEKFDNL